MVISNVATFHEFRFFFVEQFAWIDEHKINDFILHGVANNNVEQIIMWNTSCTRIGGTRFIMQRKTGQRMGKKLRCTTKTKAK